MSKPKAKTKSKAKAADPLANALEWEKKTVTAYSKMEADATKKNDRTLMKLFGDLRKDAEKHIKKIQSTMEKVKREQEKLKALKAAKKK
ncbi:MAG: ferritin-like domain-containing protein [Candidatus Jordarchaeum sp.]|uniref:ferritin-like domain-containing protein n=1 Tax=Candidatus Jordarchaeum sp. TaxID=2823881 RepID=UPI00404964F3